MTEPTTELEALRVAVTVAIADLRQYHTTHEQEFEAARAVANTLEQALKDHNLTTIVIPGEPEKTHRIPCAPDASGAVGDYRPIEERRKDKW